MKFSYLEVFDFVFTLPKFHLILLLWVSISYALELDSGSFDEHCFLTGGYLTDCFLCGYKYFSLLISSCLDLFYYLNP